MENNISTMRIRFNIKEDDVGLEPLFFYLLGLKKQTDRANVVRSLLIPPLAIEPELLDVLRTIDTNQCSDELVGFGVSVSTRDAGLQKTLKELSVLPTNTKQRSYIKRRLMILLATNGIGSMASLIGQHPKENMLPGSNQGEFATQPASVAPPTSEWNPQQQQAFSLIDPESLTLDLAPINMGDKEENNEEVNSSQKSSKSNRFKAASASLRAH